MDYTTLKYFTIYANTTPTVELLKNLWRKIAVKVHPDKGGTKEQFVEAQNEYESLLSHINAGFTAKSDSPEAYNDFMTFMANITPDVRDCVRAVLDIDGIRAVEVVGFWVHVSISKSQVKERELLKQINVDGKRFFWNRYESRWTWKGKPATSRRKYSKEEKEELWGHETYQKDKALAG